MKWCFTTPKADPLSCVTSPIQKEKIKIAVLLMQGPCYYFWWLEYDHLITANIIINTIFCYHLHWSLIIIIIIIIISFCLTLVLGMAFQKKKKKKKKERNGEEKDRLNWVPVKKTKVTISAGVIISYRVIIGLSREYRLSNT